MIRTFLDTGVLLSAWRSSLPLRAAASTIMFAADREFVSSFYVRLELMPKAIYHKQRAEVAFYQKYFDRLVGWVESSPALAVFADEIAATYGLNGMDALHLAAAIETDCVEFVTSERPTSPIFRVDRLRILSIKPSQ